mmetsp:Transcript_15106/g.18943  ORF Transcript_15106/g.18943 Transcript_15106/m.18943 type:complete len:86 (-) Transcript_15106:641-898(-)
MHSHCCHSLKKLLRLKKIIITLKDRISLIKGILQHSFETHLPFDAHKQGAEQTLQMPFGKGQVASIHFRSDTAFTYIRRTLNSRS